LAANRALLQIEGLGGTFPISNLGGNVRAVCGRPLRVEGNTQQVRQRCAGIVLVSKIARSGAELEKKKQQCQEPIILKQAASQSPPRTFCEEAD
jgi:hypothetical protein